MSNMGQFYNAPCLTPIRGNSFSTIRFIGPKIYINFLIWHFNNFNQNLLKFLFQSKPNRGCCSLMFFLNYIEVRPSTLYIPVSFLEYLRSDYVTKMNGRVWLLLESIVLDSVVVSLVSSFDSWVGPLLAQLQCSCCFVWGWHLHIYRCLHGQCGLLLGGAHSLNYPVLAAAVDQ